MFGIGTPELIVIFVIALIVIGPKKLPDLARALGRGMAEFRKATSDIRANLDMEGELKGMEQEIADSVSGFMANASEPTDKTSSEGEDTPQSQKREEETDIAEKKDGDG